MLLFKWRLQTGGFVWITPGGGLDAGESHQEAAIRELTEEIGLEEAILGPCVWLRDHVLEWNGRLIRQRERYYLVRVPSHEVDRARNDANELKVLEEFRWWTLPELEASGDDFSPSRLAFFLKPLLRGEIPLHPVDVGA